MFYEFFRIFNLINGIFGLIKPFRDSINISERPSTRLLNILWSVSIVTFAIVCYFFSVNINVYSHLKYNLPDVYGTNNLIVNVLIVILELTNTDVVFAQIYNIIRNLFRGLKISTLSIKMLSLKLYLWIIFATGVFFVLIISEFLLDFLPYVLVFKIPVFLTMVHLIVHLCLLLAFLKVINHKLSQSLNNNSFNLTKLNAIPKHPLAYLLNGQISFIEISPQYLDIKTLCHFYDDLTSCIRLLEINHGTQVFLIVWLMFSSAVIGVTMTIVTERIIPWLVISKSAEILVWYYLACYVNEQMGKEIEQTELLIIKYMIDFKCDQTRRNLLMIFKQVVSSTRIYFTACNLFRLNYGTILGTIVSIITYSIILNQLFWSTSAN